MLYLLNSEQVMMCEPHRSQHIPTLKKQWKGILGIGTYLALSIALNVRYT